MWDVIHASMRHWYELIGRGSESARNLERDGVMATLVPASRERSVVNAVVYERPEALAAAYDEIAAAYAEIGAKWTVWVHPGDTQTIELLQARGHVLDASPVAMALDLVATPPPRPPAGALEDWTAEGDFAVVGAINDRAYGIPGFGSAMAGLTEGEIRLYVARRGGEPVGCCGFVDTGDNAEVQVVAVVPEARGHGISGKLMAHGLADAVERGARTSTLVATRLGRPVYERLGYRELGALEMWELRVDER